MPRFLIRIGREARATDNGLRKRLDDEKSQIGALELVDLEFRFVPREKRLNRLEQAPTWRGAFYRAMAAAVLMLLISILLLKKPNQAIALFPIVLIGYVPISYYTDSWLYKRRMASKAKQTGGAGVK